MFVVAGGVGGVGGALVGLMRWPRWGSAKFWFVALSFMVKRTTSACPVPAAVSPRSLVRCCLAVMKPGETPITKSRKTSGTEVQFVFTQPSAAHRCPET